MILRAGQGEWWELVPSYLWLVGQPPYYLRLRDAGKTKMVARVAGMHKALTVLNTMVKNDHTENPKLT